MANNFQLIKFLEPAYKLEMVLRGDNPDNLVSVVIKRGAKSTFASLSLGGLEALRDACAALIKEHRKPSEKKE